MEQQGGRKGALGPGDKVSRGHSAPSGQGVHHPSKARRIRTTGELPDEDVLVNNEDALRTFVYDEVATRMRQSHIDTSGLTTEYLDWMLPKDADVKIWIRLLQFPILISDAELESIFELSRSTAATRAPAPGHAIYYMRSFRLTVRHLLDIIAEWESVGTPHLIFDECESWKEQTEYVALDEEIYIRYVGMSQRVSGYERFADDLVHRRGGIMGAFLTAIGSECAEVLKKCAVYEFVSAELRPYIPNDQHDGAWRAADLREQALIALMGRQSLLNRQSGGGHVSYDPSSEDKQLFKSLKTDATMRLNQLIEAGDYSLPGDAMRREAVQHIARIKALGEEFSDELGTSAVPVTAAMVDAWTKQAMAGAVYGNVLALFVGDYCPLTAMVNPAPYWEQSSRSVRFVRDMLGRLRGLELGRDDPVEIQDLLDASVLPFVNFQYTPTRKTHHAESAALLRQYIAAIKPLFVLTYETRTSGVVGDNFVGTYSPDRNIVPIAGIPRLRYFTEPGEVSGKGTRVKKAENAVNEEECFIQIPCLHPGSDRYRASSLELRRILEMTLWQLVLGFDVSLKLLSQGVPPSRAQLCKTVLQEMESKWTASGCARAIEEARKKLQTSETKRTRNYTKDPLRVHRQHLHGQAVPVNLSGVISLYWERPDGSKTRITLAGGRKSDVHPPKGAKGDDKIRRIFL